MSGPDAKDLMTIGQTQKGIFYLEAAWLAAIQLGEAMSLFDKEMP